MSIDRIMLILGALCLSIALLANCSTADQEQMPIVDATAVLATEQAAAQATGMAQAAQEQMATDVALTVSVQSTATAQAEATLQANATQTSAAAAQTAEAAATAEVATAVALAEAATATSAAEATVTARAVLTVRAAQAAEATAVFVAKREALVQETQSRPPLFGPRSGDLARDEDAFLESYWANINAGNLLAEATFIMDPDLALLRNRDIGFLFREQSTGYWQLTAMGSGEWELSRNDGGTFHTVKTGRFPSTSFAMSNTLTLYVNEAEGFFFLNGRFISDLSLTDGPETGDAAAGIGFYPRTEKRGEVTRFENFTIWPVGETSATPTPAPAPRVTAPPPGFDPTALMISLDNMRLTIEQIGGLLDRLYHGESQGCGEYMGYYQDLQQRAAFSGLPPAWQGIYGEYNFAADNIISTNVSIKTLCETGGGYLNELDYGVARQGIGLSLDRINQAIRAAQGLLNQ